MISPRMGKILKYIVGQYVASATPVPSQHIARVTDLNVSPATIRNEMALLEQEGYIFRPHISAGSVPSDKGYRFYVDALGESTLPVVQQRLISHVFHQIEGELDQWLSLAASLLSQMAQNVALVTVPRPADSKFKHVEIIGLKDSLALVVLVLQGARVKQKLINFENSVSQLALSAIADKLNTAYAGLDSGEIRKKELELSPLEKQIADSLIEMMGAGKEPAYEEPLMEGWHYMLNQPEFAHDREQVRDLMELVENRSLVKSIVPGGLRQHAVHVIIGKENKASPVQNFSVVITQYGLPDEATGVIGVVGPTRMPYSDTISAITYFSSVLSMLLARLYGRQN